MPILYTHIVHNRSLISGHTSAIPFIVQDVRSDIGSHNIIIGDQHSYTCSNSIVFGRKNQAFGNSCIIGGFKNFTHAEYSTVLSGCYNKAYAWNSIILGGWGKQRKQQQLCVEKTLL